jgi:hypothetical protein
MTRHQPDWAHGALLAVDWLDARVGAAPHGAELDEAADLAVTDLGPDALRAVFGVGCRVAGCCAAADSRLAKMIAPFLGDHTPAGMCAWLTMKNARDLTGSVRWKITDVRDLVLVAPAALVWAGQVTAGFSPAVTRDLLAGIRAAIIADPARAEAVT